MFDMKSLREALAPLRKLGEGQIEFDCAGQRIILKPLTPQEELEVFQYSRSVIQDVPEEERDIALTTLYFDRFRSGTLAMATVSIGDWVLPQDEKVVTGEVLENGTAVTLPFRVAFRDELATWARPLLERMFAKYGELQEMIGNKARNAIELDEVDLETELEEAEQRVADLRREKAARESEGRDVREEHLSATQAVSGELQREVAAIAGTERPSKSQKAPAKKPENVAQISSPQNLGIDPKPEVAPVLQARQSLIPTEAPPPMRHEAPAPQVQGVPMPESSMVNPGDEESFHAALAAEEQRQIALRARAQQMAQQMAQQGLQTGSQAPHHQAALLSREFEEEVTPLGTIPLDGKEVPAYAMPKQEVTGKTGPKAKTMAEARVNERSSGSRNPKFRPPKR